MDVANEMSMLPNGETETEVIPIASIIETSSVENNGSEIGEEMKLDSSVVVILAVLQSSSTLRV